MYVEGPGGFLSPRKNALAGSTGLRGLPIILQQGMDRDRVEVRDRLSWRWSMAVASADKSVSSY